MPTQVPEQTKNNSTFLTVMSVLAAIQVIAGGITLVEFVPNDVSGLLMLAVAAVNAGVMYYLNGKIVPLNNVVAYQPNKVTDTGLYAGGASTAPTGVAIDLETPVGVIAEKVDDRPYQGS